MLRHLVMFKKKPETDEATVAEIMRRLDALQGEIPGLIQIKCHRSIPSDRPVVWTFILDSVIESLEDLPAYRDHPAHVSVNEWMTPFLEARAVIDYEY
jgi:Stress responsive A/B Barrel Domain